MSFGFLDNTSFPSPAATTSGLIWCLDASNSLSYPGSGTTWSDLSGSSFTTTLANTTYSNSTGESIVFNGSTTTGVTTGIPSTAITNITVQVWASITTSTKGCIFKAGNNAGGYAIGLGTVNFENAGSNIVFLFSGNRWVLPGQAFTTGWHLITLTLNATSVCGGYYDTTAMTVPTGVNPAAPTTSWALGNCAGDAGTARFFNGKIGAVYAYNRVITQAEVTANYTALARRFRLIG